MLKVENITKHYGNKCVLNNVSLSVETGEVVGFLGPNGAGKSTLMKIITGYVAQESGDVEICGLKISPNDYLFKQNIGYLPEHNPLYLEMFVREYLTYVAELYRIANKKEAVEEVIIRTGLSPESRKKIGELSKGYRQRVGLAQAIIHNPKILILDEPTTGLDPNQIVEIRDLIAEIGKSHAVIFSTHILQEVAAICSRVVVINKGEIVADLQKNDLSTENLEKIFRELTLLERH
ncbi:MAG: ATP-binding cassette domain-containing protein [Prevotellaceae bacterium]|jgi:ABC-2 type transport system ATP-binding protein|nr:ATP-binding cassette domain-containing protein [Prevotellaceae bacterium]